MLLHDSGAQCSTSYSRPLAGVTLRSSDRTWAPRQCQRRVCPSLILSAAAEGDTNVARQSKRPNDLVGTPSRPFGGERRYIDFQQTENQSWADDFEQNDDWASFWDDEAVVLDDPSLDDTYDGLNSGSATNTTLLREAKQRIARDLTSPEWRSRHPNYISPTPVPRIKQYDPDIPDPEPVAPHDWTEWELRAWMEKRRRKHQTDAAWHQRQQLLGRFSVLNISEETDSRLEYGWTTTPRTWTHEDILGVITNNGQNVHPDEVKSLKVQDPQGKADYFVEGVHYVPETEEYLAEIGHLWEAESEPDLDQEVSMLASDFSALEGNSARTADGEQDGPSTPQDDNDDDNSGTVDDDEAVQLGKFFGGDV